MRGGNKGTHWLIVHGAKVILGIMIAGAIAYASVFISTVWSNEKRLDIAEPKVEKVKIILRNQCSLMRHFQIKFDDSECI